jgi:hypothetical protein
LIQREFPSKETTPELHILKDELTEVLKVLARRARDERRALGTIPPDLASPELVSLSVLRR